MQEANRQTVLCWPYQKSQIFELGFQLRRGPIVNHFVCPINYSKKIIQKIILPSYFFASAVSDEFLEGGIMQLILKCVWGRRDGWQILKGVITANKFHSELLILCSFTCLNGLGKQGARNAF